ncbi:hypothetical protein KFZ70_07690 [Tamlana fucoidanivorans]|uniref:hypothetical protein n=1 Tax=Allotamlana fucoidanivorans TaxID=2583814 RepID=UPI0018EEB681|nr:hypothetical protein [Tamlana fucoidanivorans]
MSKFKFTIPCNEANHVCDKSQYKNASFWEKIKLSFHLIYCRACKDYSSNNKKLSQAIDKSNIDCLDPKCKKAMKKELEKALAEQKNKK